MRTFVIKYVRDKDARPEYLPQGHIGKWVEDLKFAHRFATREEADKERDKLGHGTMVAPVGPKKAAAAVVARQCRCGYLGTPARVVEHINEHQRVGDLYRDHQHVPGPAAGWLCRNCLGQVPGPVYSEAQVREAMCLAVVELCDRRLSGDYLGTPILTLCEALIADIRAGRISIMPKAGGTT